MSSEKSIVTHGSVAAYFKEQLDTLCGVRKVELTEPAGFYVVNLLSDFADSDNLFLPSDDARTRELVPLAELMARAADAVGEERVKLLKHLADSSLYISGFFQESLGRHNVDVDYYVDMGGRAYGQLSGAPLRGEQSKWRPVFEELSQKFERLTDLLAEMAELNVGLAQGAQKMLRMYEKWLETGSAALGAKLRKRGMLPGGGLAQ